MLGIVSAGITAYYIMKHDGRGWHVHIFDFTMYCGLSGIVGGRLWDVFFFDWPYYHNHLAEIPYVWQGGYHPGPVHRPHGQSHERRRLRPSYRR